MTYATNIYFLLTLHEDCMLVMVWLGSTWLLILGSMMISYHLAHAVFMVEDRNKRNRAIPCIIKAFAQCAICHAR